MNYYKYFAILLLLLSWSNQGLAQNKLAQNRSIRPTAHYPLEAYDKNPTVGYQRFLLIRPWDVSGNARHGTIMGDNAFDQTPGKYKGFEAGKWIGETQGNTTVANFRPCLKKSTENHSKDSYITIPSPFESSDINQTGFTVTFWYNPGNTRNDLIMTTEMFSIAVISDGIKIHHIQDNDEGYHIFNFETGSCLPNSWTFISFVYDVSSKRISCYQQAYTSYNRIYTTMFPNVRYNGNNVEFVKSKNTVNQICGNNFSGEISNVRFYDTPLQDAQVNEVKKIDLDWSNRTHNLNSYIEKGCFMKYTFDNGSMQESINNLQGTSSGSVSPTADRFGQAKNAINFSGTNAYIDTPSFFDATMPVISYNPSIGGVTFSFWVKTDVAHEYPANSDELQNLYKNFGGSTKKIFYANNSHNDELFGMQRFKGALGQIRYTQNAQNQLQSWFFWLYNRVAFARQGDKWYHVIYVQHPNWQRVYVAKKEDSIDCLCEETDINCWNHCRNAYNYQGIQSLSDATTFGFGNNQGKAIANLDDVRVYHWPLSPAEVKQLHKIESSNPLLQRNNSRKRMLDSENINKISDIEKPDIEKPDIEKSDIEKFDIETSLILFPNPSGDFINFKSSENIDSVKIISMLGQVTNYPVVNDRIEISDLASGIYLLKVLIDDKTETIRFIKK